MKQVKDIGARKRVWLVSLGLMDQHKEDKGETQRQLFCVSQHCRGKIFMPFWTFVTSFVDNTKLTIGNQPVKSCWIPTILVAALVLGPDAATPVLCASPIWLAGKSVTEPSNWLTVCSLCIGSSLVYFHIFKSPVPVFLISKRRKWLSPALAHPSPWHHCLPFAGLWFPVYKTKEPSRNMSWIPVLSHLSDFNLRGHSGEA